MNCCIKLEGGCTNKSCRLSVVVMVFPPPRAVRRNSRNNSVKTHCLSFPIRSSPIKNGFGMHMCELIPGLKYYEMNHLWPYLGKPGLTKTPLNRFSISTHFGNVRMHYRSFSMHFKTLTTFANENEMHWRSFWIHFESFAPRFKTFTTHFSEAVSHWKTFTKVQTTQQNTRTLNTSTKSMNMHCVLIEQQML